MKTINTFLEQMGINKDSTEIKTLKIFIEQVFKIRNPGGKWIYTKSMKKKIKSPPEPPHRNKTLSSYMNTNECNCAAGMTAYETPARKWKN